MKSIFEVCTPREDILRGEVKESSYAADLAQVLKNEGPLEYKNANTFYENTYPTEGLKNLLSNVCKRLSGSGKEAASIFRLDTQYGGGKTHALIALAHLAREGGEIEKIDELVSRKLLPDTEVAIGAFDGENSDPLNGRDMPGDVKAYTPWGELACQLGGSEGYMKVRESDLERVAPGSETLRSLFGDRPVLILLDELSIYLRKIQGRNEEHQMTPFLTSLFKAIESAPKAVLVFTLAIGREGIASDAYAKENELLAKQIEELTSVAGRKATTLDPTSENETAQVLRRRLFSKIDFSGLEENVQAYKEIWHKHQDQLPDQGVGESWEEEFRNSFPFHPNLMSVLTNKLSTLSNFQRVRGMLRLLAGAVSELWAKKPSETFAIHLQHLNPANEGIRNEIVTRLELSAFDPAIRNDITDPASVSNDLDTKHHAGMAPLTSYLSRSILWHTFAFNEPIKGVPSDELNFALLYPGIDPSFINDARQRFIQNSGFLDDKPMAPLKFLTEANLNVLIRRKERDINPGDSRDQLQDRIRNIFDAKTFNLIVFPSGPFDVPDEVGDGRPQLVLIHYENMTVYVEPDSVPKSIEDMFNTHGAQGNFRQLKNNLIFLVAEDQRIDEMKGNMTRRLALEALQSPDQLQSLPDHQQYKVQELYKKADQEKRN